MMKPAHKFEYHLNLKENQYKEIVYLSDKQYNRIPTYINEYWPERDYNSIQKKYFTQEKIEELKKKICEQIMNDTCPFIISLVDMDYQKVEEKDIWL